MSIPPITALLQDGLDPVIVLARDLLELVANNEPAGKRPRRFLDVLLGIMAPSQCAELHHFTGVVLVGLALLVLLLRAREAGEVVGLARREGFDAQRGPFGRVARRQREADRQPEDGVAIGRVWVARAV